jgi:hypothetical protein
MFHPINTVGVIERLRVKNPAPRAQVFLLICINKDGFTHGWRYVIIGEQPERVFVQ